MCGIVGYIGNKKASPVLINGLLRLEYRGYDSAGICVKRGNDFYVEKVVGGYQKLKEKVKISCEEGVGIAHTRWATHGEISVKNAHPHFSKDGSVALVHNGIIDNFEILKKQLEEKGIYFYGETDSEVVCKLFEGKLNLKKIFV